MDDPDKPRVFCCEPVGGVRGVHLWEDVNEKEDYPYRDPDLQEPGSGGVTHEVGKPVQEVDNQHDKDDVEQAVCDPDGCVQFFRFGQ